MDLRDSSSNHPAPELHQHWDWLGRSAVCLPLIRRSQSEKLLLNFLCHEMGLDSCQSIFAAHRYSRALII